MAGKVQDGGVQAVVVDMESFVGVGDLKDGLHPDDGGYARMGDAWLAGLEFAAGAGWLTEPVGVNSQRRRWRGRVRGEWDEDEDEHEFL